jgi:hypothetical protein
LRRTPQPQEVLHRRPTSWHHQKKFEIKKSCHPAILSRLFNNLKIKAIMPINPVSAVLIINLSWQSYNPQIKVNVQ